MTMDELQEEVDKLLDDRDKLEETCDTLPQCSEDDGCDTCKVYNQIADIDDKIEALEDKIESLMGDEEEE